jgi:hypothetical protein
MVAQTRLPHRAPLSGVAASLAAPRVLRGLRAEPARDISENVWKRLNAKITGGVLRPPDPRLMTDLDPLWSVVRTGP